jgi:sialate O-acetylesterase
MKRLILAALILAPMFIADAALAAVKLSRAFGNHMVLQQEQPIRLFGSADPGEKVTAELAGQTATATAGEKGRFRIELPAMKADGKSHTLTVKGQNTITLTDVLLGEVWICSGQSNMEWSVGGTLNSKEEIAAAEHPQIRLFNVPGHVQGPVPSDDPRGSWQLCSPNTIRGFSAVGYFFGRSLQKELNVPIGLVGTNWGGTRIEPWTPPVGFQQVPQLKDYVASLDSIDPTKPGKPKGGATYIYNGMVHGLIPLSVRGAIWYQGESNAGDGLRYEYLKEALVKGWRTVFENNNLSFYWVQLANFQGPNNNPAGGGWGPVREGQRRALRLPNTGMAVIIDVGNARDIHPRNKQDVGARLALLALAKDYGRDIVPCGPLYKSMKIEGNKIRISFDHVGGGLITAKKEGLNPTQETSGAELTHFAIQADDGKWHWAKANIDGETVVVWAEGVVKPKHVRFGYQSNPVGINLYNKQGLPASPFTTD